MLNRLRVLLGFAFVAGGTLGTTPTPVAAHRGPRASATLLPPPGTASRPRRSPVALPHDDALPAAGGDASGATRAGVEAGVRRLVAEQLGVDVEQLVPEVSLPDELAVDSLELLELAAVVEGQFAIALPTSGLERVRTFRDLVDLVMASGAAGHPAEPPTPSVPVRVRFVSPRDRAAGLERVGALTPYAMELILDDATRAGRRGPLEVTISGPTDDTEFAAILQQLGELGRRGIPVLVHRDGDHATLHVATENAG